MTRQTYALVALALTCLALLSTAVWWNSGSANEYHQDLEYYSRKCEAERQSKEGEYKKDCQRILYRTLDDPVAILTGGLVIATIALFVVTYLLYNTAARQSADAKEAGRAARESAEAAKRSADTALNEFREAHRAKLRLRRVVLDMPGIVAGSRLAGKIDLMNKGDFAADILDSTMNVFWSDQPLPHEPPLPKGIGAEEQFTQPFSIHKVYSPGVKLVLGVSDCHTGRFEAENCLTEADATSICDPDGSTKLYIIGYIGYRNSTTEAEARSFYRDFAFRYDASQSRFKEITDNPDYSYDTGDNR